MELKSGYKQTEVGVIPDDWKVETVDYLFEKVTSGLSRQLKSFDVGIPVLTSGNISERKVSIKDLKYWFNPDPQGANIDDYILSDGDILVCFINSLAQIGKPCIFRDVGRPVIYTTNLFRGIVSNRTSREFIFYLLETSFFQKQVQLIAKPAVNQASFTKPDFLRIEIPLPPTKAEQEAIAEALSDADALIASLEQLIAKKRLIKQGAMQELLTGKRRLPGFSGDWEVKTLGELLTVHHGKSQREVEVPNGKYPILASGGEIGRTDTPLYEYPSVLIGRKGTIDAPQYASTPFWTVDTLFYTKVAADADPKFLFYKFNLIPWRRYNEASGVPSLNAKTIELIEVFVPSGKKEQIAIATALSEMDTEIDALETKLSKARLLKHGMMQELLTGKIRLV